LKKDCALKFVISLVIGLSLTSAPTIIPTSKKTQLSGRSAKENRSIANAMTKHIRTIEITITRPQSDDSACVAHVEFEVVFVSDRINTDVEIFFPTRIALPSSATSKQSITIIHTLMPQTSEERATNEEIFFSRSTCTNRVHLDILGRVGFHLETL